MFNPIGSNRPIGLSHRTRSIRQRGFVANLNQVKRSDRDLVETYVGEDNDVDKSHARRWVEKRFAKLAWYNPNKDKPELDIKKGWAYYDHFTLARYDDAAPDGTPNGADRRPSIFQHADPVMSEVSKLYRYFTTPISAFSEWGIGIALYFNALRVFTYALLIGGIISIPNMLFFKSSDYNSSPAHGEESFSLMGSAVCTAREWVTCEADWCDPTKMKSTSIPFATFIDDEGVTKTFVERNLCEGGFSKIITSNYVTLLALAIFTMVFNSYQKRLAVRLDEDLLTASDYSIHIKNPPPDAKDPEEWRKFFLRYAEGPKPHIAACTIVLNNEFLIWQLINRRICRFELQKLLPNTNIDDVDALETDVKKHIAERDKMGRSCFNILFTFTIRPILKLINRFVPAEQLLDKIKLYTDNIKTFQEKEYVAKHVFITFETEIGQRKALTELQHGKIQIRKNNYDDANMNNLFRNEHLLDVNEPSEPSAIRYQDLTTPNFSKNMRVLITTVITLGLVALSAYLVQLTRRNVGALAAGIVTSVLNLIIPQIVKLLLLIEKHDSEGLRQRSLYTKITIFRWLVTVFLTKFLTDFRLTLSDERLAYLPAVRGIFASEIFLVPVLRYLDLGGNLSKHYFGPRASTPDQMYLCFKGTPYNLAERYTDLTKILLLSYYSCGLYPVALLFGSMALFLRYYIDKFLLLRTWRSAPYFGTQLATFSGNFFFTGAIVIATIASAYQFAFLQYDNVCKSDISAQTYTNIDATFSNNTQGPLNVTSGMSVRVCTESSCCQEQHFWNKMGLLAPWDDVLRKHMSLDFSWMSDDQNTLSYMFATTGVCLLFGYIIILFGSTFLLLFKNLYRGVYEESGQIQNIDHCTVEGIDGYVPQMILGRFPFPLLFCDVDDIDESMVGWADPNTNSDHKYRDYNLIYDIDTINNSPPPFQLNKNDESDNDSDVADQIPGETPLFSDGPLFSIVKCWERVGNGM